MTFALSARWASCSGRTFDGPQPKRPSAGLSSSGMVSVVALVVMGLLGVGMGVPRRAAERHHRSPGVAHLETPVATARGGYRMAARGTEPPGELPPGTLALRAS